MFPLVVDLRSRRVLVIGAGRVGAHKVSQLLAAGARVTVFTEEVRAPVASGIESLVLRAYQPGDLEGAFLVVSATGDGAVNDLVVQEARELNILLNVVDDAGRSNFFFTAVHRDGDVVVSVSTEGSSPALAQWVRNAVALALPKNLAAVARQLRKERDALHSSGKSTENLEWMSRVQELIRENETTLPSRTSMQ
jgi:precorrin-2 dehydrogenase/sirohydrochlorin ferrochelatase